MPSEDERKKTPYYWCKNLGRMTTELVCKKRRKKRKCNGCVFWLAPEAWPDEQVDRPFVKSVTRGRLTG